MLLKPIAALIASGSIALFATAAHAQTDLMGLYREAMTNDAQYTSARFQLEANREKIPQARAGLLPQIGLSATLNQQAVDTHNPSLTIGQKTHRDFLTQSYGVSLTQPLFRMANLETYEQSKLQVVASEAQFAQAKQDLIVRVSQAYFDVLGAQDTLAFIQAQKRAISEQLASAKRNFEVGTATVTDQQEAQARFDLASAQEIAAQNDLAVKMSALQQIVGRPVQGSLKTLRSDTALTAPQPANIESWIDQSRSSNFLVAAQQALVEISKREIARNRAGHMPTVDLTAQMSHGKNLAINTVGVTINTAAIGVAVNVPLYAGGAVNARVAEAVKLKEKAEADLDLARRNSEQGARQAFLGVNNGLAQVQALQAAERSSELALKSNQLGYQVGVRINIDVLNSQQQLFSTRRDLAKARYDTLMASLKLKAAAGTLDENDIAQINNFLTLAAAPTDSAVSVTPVRAMDPAAADSMANARRDPRATAVKEPRTAAGTVAPKSVDPKIPSGR